MKTELVDVINTWLWKKNIRFFFFVNLMLNNPRVFEIYIYFFNLHDNKFNTNIDSPDKNNFRWFASFLKYVFIE